MERVIDSATVGKVSRNIVFGHASKSVEKMFSVSGVGSKLICALFRAWQNGDETVVNNKHDNKETIDRE